MTKLNELAQQILAAKYYQPGETCPEDVFRRVAKVVAIPDVIDVFLRHDGNENYHIDDYVLHALGEFRYLGERVAERRSLPVNNFKSDIEPVIEVWKEEQEKYYKAMCDLDFLPGTPILINAGTKVGMLSSCFAIRIEDSMESIFDVVKEVAIISQKGGGVGLSVDSLRPEGSPVGVGKGTSSGPISFLKVFNESGNQIKSGGIRRAALLAGMRVDHPDIFKFISCKEKEGDLSNFNLSVFITDSFMEALKNDHYIELTHPKCKETKRVKAKEIWNEIIKRAHANGEPGIIFQDRINKDDPVQGKYGNVQVNPCNEVNIHNYSSCNLASINLANFVTDNKVDFKKLEEITNLGIRFLDNIIDINNYPIEKIKNMTLKIRPIGLGIMGLHDLMLKLGIEYGSDSSLGLIQDIYSIIKPEANKTSEYLAVIRGIPEDLKEFGSTKRNGCLLTIAPTGTISIIANQTSSGIEPIFQWEYLRKDSYGTHKMVHWLIEKLDKEQGIFESLPSYAKTALEISPENHLRVLAQAQKSLDGGISKTINCPNNYTVEDIDNIYRKAYDLGCKSVTVYRTGSRKEEVLVKKQEEKVVEAHYSDTSAMHKEESKDIISKAEKTSGVMEPKVPPRPAVLFGCTYCIRTSLGKVYITINEDKSGVREVFITLSKAGSTMNAHCSVEGRMISNQLKYGVPLQSIINHLKDTKDMPTWWNGIQINSVPDAVAKALEDYVKNFEGFSEFMEASINEEGMQRIQNAEEDKGDFEPCPECGSALKRESGCKSCTCGYSACG